MLANYVLFLISDMYIKCACVGTFTTVCAGSNIGVFSRKVMLAVSVIIFPGGNCISVSAAYK